MPRAIDESLLCEIVPGGSPVAKFDQSGQRHVWHCVTAEGHEVVVKITKAWHETQARPAERILRQHEHEIRAMQLCDSPHIAQLIDVGALSLGDGFVTVYQVERYVPGLSLHAHIQQWKSSATDHPSYDLSVLTMDLAASLQELYKHHLIHRDIKPLNIIVRRDSGHAVLIDLGIVLSPDFTRVTRPGEISAHTPAYQSPEQARRQRELGWESDLFCMGLCLYEAATGSHPFGYCSSADEYRRAIINDSHAPLVPSQVISARLCKTIDMMLKKYAYQRCPTPDDLISMLDH